MAKKYHNKLITEMNNLLDGKKKLTLENVVFGPDERGFAPDENAPGYDWTPSLESDEDGENVQEIPNDPEVTGLMNNIRQLAIQGLAKLANSPESPQYDVLSKIWQILDKSVELGKK